MAQAQNSRKRTGGGFRLRLSPPRNRWDIAGTHLVWILGAGILLAGSFLPLERVPWLGHSHCVLLEFTGVPCPFCGGTRAFQALSRGEWSAGFGWNPLAALLYFLTWLVFLAGLAALASRRSLQAGLPGNAPAGVKVVRGFWILFLAMLLGNWIYLCSRF